MSFKSVSTRLPPFPPATFLYCYVLRSWRSTNGAPSVIWLMAAELVGEASSFMHQSACQAGRGLRTGQPEGSGGRLKCQLHG